MKLIITESRRDKLAKQELTDEFSNMYISNNYYTDSNGEHLSIEYRNGDGVIMIYGDTRKALYICEDVTQPLRAFGYTPQEAKKVIGEWFSEFFELPVSIVHHVDKDRLQ